MQADEHAPSSPEEKTIVAVCSTMRSGSTLLKALLAVPDDVSDLPETNFQKYKGYPGVCRMAALTHEPIIVLKRPAWYHEISFYPKLAHSPRVRAVALFRDTYDTVESLKKMMFGRFAPQLGAVCNRWLAEGYWAPITRNLLNLAEAESAHVASVRYEDMLSEPITETGRLYRFIGSAQNEGVDSYNPPANYSWQWGSDDGSDRIKSLKVHPPKERKRDNTRLWKIIETSKTICELRNRLGYSGEKRPD